MRRVSMQGPGNRPNGPKQPRPPTAKDDVVQLEVAVDDHGLCHVHVAQPARNLQAHVQAGGVRVERPRVLQHLALHQRLEGAALQQLLQVWEDGFNYSFAW